MDDVLEAVALPVREVVPDEVAVVLRADTVADDVPLELPVAVAVTLRAETVAVREAVDEPVDEDLAELELVAVREPEELLVLVAEAVGVRVNVSDEGLVAVRVREPVELLVLVAEDVGVLVRVDVVRLSSNKHTHASRIRVIKPRMIQSVKDLARITTGE